MSNIIDSIQLSGSSYDVRDKSATTVVEITQSDYDNLPSSAKTSNILYIITDGSVDYITSAQCQTQINNSISGKQDKLVSGTNIKTINNESLLGSGNIDIQGGGGGKAVSGGTNISVTTGETADTINCTLPITISDSANGSKQSIAIGSGSSAHISNWYDSIAIGKNSKGYFGSVVIGSNPTAYATGNGGNVAIGNETKFYNNSIIIGNYAQGYNGYNANSVAIGVLARANNIEGAVAIGYDVYTSDTTKTNINNQIKIDSSNQVYIYNKDNTEMICLQDQLGGGGSSYTAGDGIDITNDVISVTGKVDTTTYNTYTAATATAIGNKLAVSDFNSYSGSVDTAINSKASQSDLSTLSGTVTAHTANTDIHVTIADKSSWNGAATNASNAVTALGGLSIVKLTQAQYDSLATKDNSTLYVIVN